MGNIFGPSSELAKIEDKIPPGERIYGYENFGNTCYANSVLQALYATREFREGIVKCFDKGRIQHATVVELARLFKRIQQQEKKFGKIAPGMLIDRIRKDSLQFAGYEQQDSQEFFSWLINICKDKIKGKLVSELFEGVYATEVRCTGCEQMAVRKDTFLDLHIEITPNISLTQCLKNFSAVEFMRGKNKYYCESCLSYQEAMKTLKIYKSPPILCISLKRFKFEGNLFRKNKLSFRVPFPTQIRITNHADASDPLYSLYSIVIHEGTSGQSGHYKAINLVADRYWIEYDDDSVTLLSEDQVESTYGACPPSLALNPAYMLFYRRV